MTELQPGDIVQYYPNRQTIHVKRGETFLTVNVGQHQVGKILSMATEIRCGHMDFQNFKAMLDLVAASSRKVNGYNLTAKDVFGNMYATLR